MNWLVLISLRKLSRYKESISKVRGLKEKLIAHNDSVKELGRGVQREMSARFAGVSKMIERLDITQKRAGASVPLSSYTMGTSKSPRGKGNQRLHVSSLCNPHLEINWFSGLIFSGKELMIRQP